MPNALRMPRSAKFGHKRWLAVAVVERGCLLQQRNYVQRIGTVVICVYRAEVHLFEFKYCDVLMRVVAGDVSRNHVVVRIHVLDCAPHSAEPVDDGFLVMWFVAPRAGAGKIQLTPCFPREDM